MASAGASRVVAVAYSGGRDSSALLHATHAAASALGIDVLALHVNHGLSAFADGWEAHCRRFCEEAGIAFASQRVATRPARGDSVEAWARDARRAALRQMATAAGAGLLLLAHHQRDQAETLLLQALRGGGVAGLAGMPRQVLRDGITWARPWLGVSREAIEAYAARHAIAHVDDDSNTDRRLARNRLRLDVWPALVSAFPQADAALAKATGWAQQAVAGLDEIAAADLAALDAASPEAAGALPLGEWQRLSPARRSNALRAWLRRAAGQGASAALIERLLAELPGRGSASWPCGEGWWLRRHRGLLRLLTDPVATRLAAAPSATGSGRFAALPAAAAAATAFGPAATPPSGCGTQSTRPSAAVATACGAAATGIAPATAAAADRPRARAAVPAGGTAAAATTDAPPPGRPGATLTIRRAGRHRVPGWSGSIVAERVDAGGVPLAWLARLDVKQREGGERFQTAIGRPPRSLKKQFQAAGLAAWERDAPLLFSGGQLVFVPGLGIDARVVALPGQPQMRLHWLPAVAGSARTAIDQPAPAKIEG